LPCEKRKEFVIVESIPSSSRRRDVIVESNESNPCEEKHERYGLPGERVAFLRAGTPGITRILLYILYAKFLLCRVSQHKERKTDKDWIHSPLLTMMDAEC
jgi:hypothetical protein